MNRVDLPGWAVERGRERGGFSALNARRTALLVIDLQNGFVATGYPLANIHAIDIIANVNRIAAALRDAGGRVIFLRHTVSDDPPYALTEWQKRLVPRDPDGHFSFQPGRPAHQLFPALQREGGDLVIDKHRFSAFLPNSSDLDDRLRAAGIDTIIISGTITNVCCECTARDGNMLGYKVLFLTDATAAFTDEEHNAALLSMATVFAEVRCTDDALALIASGVPPCGAPPAVGA